MEKQFEPVRRARGPKWSFIAFTLAALSVLSGGMLWLALPNLMTGDEGAVAFKATLIAVAAMLAGYAINRLAVERGTLLATRGYRAAGAVSAVSILVVGGGMFSATYAGLTFNDVEQLRLDAHGEALSEFVSKTSSLAARAGRITPAIATVVVDLRQKYACELSESCLSGFSGGGNGPVARAVLEKLGRAEALSQQVVVGATARDEAIAIIETLFGEYQAIANAEDTKAKDRRKALRAIDLKIKQAAANLTEAMPVALLAAYAEELKSGVQIDGRPEASAKVSAIMRQHGQTLNRLLAGIAVDGQDSPAFPKATGVSETFAYIGHFLPVAAIAAVVEMVFPISLWLYTLFALSWALYRQAPPDTQAPSAEDVTFANLVGDIEPDRDDSRAIDQNVQQALPHPRRPRHVNARHGGDGSHPRAPRR